MPLAPGTLLHNRYRIVSILGQGGMGAVYRASDEHLLIPVAVKENLFLTEEYGRQFQREATILAGLRHSNLPHVTDYFALENQGQYLVMDYIEGEDLRQRMERMGCLPEREAVLIGISICDALTYLHTRRPPIVHRDIKPGNIKVTPDGQAVLVDFGLAKIMQLGQATSTGARAMTPGYSPPEQYGTARTDHRSDIYSLGATLYAALTGVIPEDGLARMTGKAKITPIRELAPKTSRKLAEAIERALEVEADQRYQDAEAFKNSLIEAGELSSFYKERPTITPPPVEVASNLSSLSDPLQPGAASGSRPSRSSARRRRNRRIGWVLAPGFALLALTAIVLLFLRPDLAHSVLAYLGPDPTLTSQPMEIASQNPSQPTAPVLMPTDTTAPGITETPAPTLTPALEETPTVDAAVGALLPPTPTPLGGGMGQIAFASDRIGKVDVWLANADPKNPATRQITNFREGACQPSWSPDGLRLAVTSPCPGKQDMYPGSNIYIVNADGSGEPIQLTSSLEGDFDPAWSPDGKRIAFTSLRNGTPAIFVINLDDPTRPQELSRVNKPDKQPAWSPSGTQIAFVRQFINSQIWIMSDNGEIQDQFSFSGPVNNLWPSWSADGSVIFYSQAPSDTPIPWLVYRRYEDRRNQLETRIPIVPGSNIGPVSQVHPSPDGFWLAYESWPSGDNHDIYIMSVNGSNQQRLTTDPGEDFDPAWRPLAGP